MKLGSETSLRLSFGEAEGGEDMFEEDKKNQNQSQNQDDRKERQKGGTSSAKQSDVSGYEDMDATDTEDYEAGFDE